MPTDNLNDTMERRQMLTKHGIVPMAAYDLVIAPQ